MKTETRKPETATSFITRVEYHSGLRINRIPDAEPEVLATGSGQIICTSTHGTLMLVDYLGRDPETGVNLYRRAVLVYRGEELAPADKDADGIIPTDA